MLLKRKGFRIVVFLFTVLISLTKASAQQCLVFMHDDGWSAVPLKSIDSIKVVQAPWLDVFMGERKIMVPAVFTQLVNNVPDTLCILFSNNDVIVKNPRLDLFRVDVNQANVTVTATGGQPFVCKAEGSSENGRLIIDSDTTCTLVLSGLSLTSRRASAISFPQKQKVRIELEEGTRSTLSDAPMYQTDSTDVSNACLYARGSLTISGSGTLEVTGNYRHAIASGNNITIEEGHIITHDAVKDCLHCDKLRMAGGILTMTVTHDGAKGVKCKDYFTMTGGCIEGEATGHVIIKDGEPTYCSLLKSGGGFLMEGGTINLRHQGDGGRCISVDGNMTMTAGTMDLACHGNGGSYLTVEQDTDYYTPKCITVNGITRIERGHLSLLATGDGGKGLDCSDTLFIGRKGENFVPVDSLVIVVETHGSALVDNIDEDFRKGCPKAVKSDKDIEIFSGNLNLFTNGQGGEGIESKASLHAHKATIIADTYDDCFNTGECCHIDGAHVYCLSHNNDGIDSNGSIIISDGVVASVNQTKPNESFDTDDGELHLYGGIVFGIGSGPVNVKESYSPCYSTPYMVDEGPTSRGLIFTEGKYVYLQKDDGVAIALYNENKAFRTFLTIMSPTFMEGDTFSIRECDTISNASEVFFDNKLVVGGTPSTPHHITTIQVRTIE